MDKDLVCGHCAETLHINECDHCYSAIESGQALFCDGQDNHFCEKACLDAYHLHRSIETTAKERR
jgi:hypothetical protein